MTSDEIIEVVQAHKDGKQIECRSRSLMSEGSWRITATPAWEFPNYDYRVKREPREVWIGVSKEHGYGPVYDSREMAWLTSPLTEGVIRFREVLDD